ncbi:MAG: NAD(P)/FAD-dependent oxidoreductase [Bdellovibrionales bacterium]|nr:NAD(P)/FAD-dependent oxidoreductase [Bdellovibrionales bacterium]
MVKKKIVVVGGGFGGVSAVDALSANPEFEIHLVDRRNFHLFQPLLYQIAMAGLSPSDIAIPLRTLFRKKRNVHITLAEVDQLDIANNKIHYDKNWVEFDYLVLCCGAKHAYFGNEKWEEFAPGLKNLEQAIEIRRRILMAFELAEKETDPIIRSKELTFVVVGGGPTGVELAGAIAEMAKHTLANDYHNADLAKIKVMLVEAGPCILAAFPQSLSLTAQKNLKELGVEVIINTRASDLSKDGLQIGDQYVPAKTIIWAAGVLPSSLTMQIPGEKDRLGRALVLPDLSLPEFKNVFVIGDQAACKSKSGEFLPGIAPVAMQQGAFLKDVIVSDMLGRARPTFEYVDKGIMATIGRSKAVVSTKGFNFSGLPAWLAWVFIHLIYLMKFKNRLFVFLQWAWSYFTFGRGARLITHKTWRFYDGEKIKLE